MRTEFQFCKMERDEWDDGFTVSGKYYYRTGPLKMVKMQILRYMYFTVIKKYT